MSKKDQIKWNKKFSEKANLLEQREASNHLQNIINDGKGKIALDLACGAGRNTLFLAKKGFKIFALDISNIALDTVEKLVQKENVEDLVHTSLSDLDEFAPEMPLYDLIIMSNYLDRDLIQRAKVGLKKDGLFFIETYMDDINNEKKDSNPDYLLKKEELKSFFIDGYEEIFYDEFDNESYEMYRMKKQIIVVKKL